VCVFRLIKPLVVGADRGLRKSCVCARACVCVCGHMCVCIVCGLTNTHTCVSV